MDIQPLLAYNTWLSLPIETRQKLEKLFDIPRSGEVVVRVGEISPQGNISGTATSDGHSAKDFYAITVEKMQEVLGTTETDFYSLFNDVVRKIDTGFSFFGNKPALAMSDINLDTAVNSMKAGMADGIEEMVDNTITEVTITKNPKKTVFLTKKTAKKQKDGKKKK